MSTSTTPKPKEPTDQEKAFDLFGTLEAIVFIPSLVDDTEKTCERLRKLVRKVHNILPVSIGDINMPFDGCIQTFHATDRLSVRTTQIMIDTFCKIGLEATHKKVSPINILNPENEHCRVMEPVAELVRRTTRVLLLVRPRGDGFFMHKITGDLCLTPPEGALIWYPLAQGYEEVIWNK